MELCREGLYAAFFRLPAFDGAVDAPTRCRRPPKNQMDRTSGDHDVFDLTVRVTRQGHDGEYHRGGDGGSGWSRGGGSGAG
jgi:hypothetical protein